MITEQRLYAIEDKIRKLYCCLKDSGGGNETDPVFRASVAFTITQADIDNWNQGGGGTGDYVPMAGMNVQAGERMNESFVLANYDMFTEQPPDNSIAFGIGQELGGVMYNGTAKYNGNGFSSTLNMAPTSFQSSVSLQSPTGGYYGNMSMGPTNTFSGTTGSSPDGNYSASSNISSNLDLVNKSTYVRLITSGNDNSNQTAFYYELNVSERGISMSGLPQVTGDPLFDRVVVMNGNDILGWDSRNPSLEFLPGVDLGGSSGGFGSASIFKKGNVYIVHVTNFYIPGTVPKQESSYIGDLPNYMQSPWGIMFPCTVRLADGIGGNITYLTYGIFEGTGLLIQMPPQALVQPGLTKDVYISMKFQIVPTNV